MRKLLFAIVALFVAAPSFAQFSSGGFSLDEEHMYWGMRIGINMSSIGGDLKTDKGRTGMTLAGIVGLRVSESTPVFLESGLYYTQRGANKLEDVVENDGTVKVKPGGHLNYFEIPVLMKYGISTENNVAILPFVGPYLAFAIAGDTRYLNRTDMGFKVGCGVEWNNLYIEGAYQFGITNIADDDHLKISSPSAHGHGFNINFGINF